MLRPGFEETSLMGGGGASLGRHLLKCAQSPNTSAPLFKGGLAGVEYKTQATGGLYYFCGSTWSFLPRPSHYGTKLPQVLYGSSELQDQLGSSRDGPRNLKHTWSHWMGRPSYCSANKGCVTSNRV